MASNEALISSENIQLVVNSPLHWFFGGPRSILIYQLVQGLFTMLSLKELWSITSVLVRGRSDNLDINHSITWNMVTQFEDLRKTILKICLPCLQDFRRLAHGESTLISRRGWRRILGSFSIAILLFAFDIALIVAQAPTEREIDASSMQLVSWANNGDIPILNERNILRSGFTRPVILESRLGGVEMTHQLNVDLERTDIRDFSGTFNAELPVYNGTFLEMDRSEEWRMVMRIHCTQRLYQYRLRFDLSLTGTGNTWYVPTWNFFNNSIVSNTRTLSEYQEAMSKQLNIDSSVVWSNETYAMLRTTDISAQPPEFTNLTDGSVVLTHDAIASIFFNTIRILVGNTNTVMFERKENSRVEQLLTVRGGVARSQRPYVPLSGSILIYVCLAAVSALLQWKTHVGEVAKELNVVLELRCKRKHETIGVLNVEGEPLEKLESELVRPAHLHTEEEFFDVVPLEDTDLVSLRHNGFLPAKLLLDVQRFMEAREDLSIEAREAFYSEWGIVRPKLRPKDTKE